MTPDYDYAAIRATETLLNYHVTSAPVIPLPILKSMQGVLVLSFAEMADTMGIDRKTAVHLFGDANQDAATIVKRVDDKLRYVIAYNQRLPFYLLQRSLARELGHIVMRHDGSRPDNVRTEEAIAFARHFLCPRPLVRLLQEAAVPLTVELIGNITGCYERCIAGLRKTPGSHVPAELNRLLKDRFRDYITNFLDFHQHILPEDESAIADLGTFMDNYED